VTAMYILQLSGATDVSGVLALCGALSLGVFVYVFYLSSAIAAAPEKTRLTYLRERKETIYDNLRDLNFEYKAGKFPDSDYQELRTELEEEAAAVLAEIESLERTSSAPLFKSLLRGGKPASDRGTDSQGAHS
jgi:hypothetical protein